MISLEGEYHPETCYLPAAVCISAGQCDSCDEVTGMAITLTVLWWSVSLVIYFDQ